MTEGKRIWRYLSNGSIMLGEVMIFVSVSFLLAGMTITELLHLLPGFGLAKMILVIFLMTAIGALSSYIYHVIFDLLPVGLNYKDLLTDCANRKLITFYWRDTMEPVDLTNNAITNQGSSRILIALWQASKSKSKTLEISEQKLTCFSDFANFLGATFISSLCAYFTWSFFYIYKIGDLHYEVFWFVVFLVPVLIHYIVFRNVVEAAKSVISQTLVNELKERNDISRNIYVSDLEFAGKNKCCCA